MKHIKFALSVALVLCVIAWMSGRASAATLQQFASYSLDGVKGRIDHLAYDGANHRLFVAALGNNTVEAIDTVTGKRLKTITGEAEPQGVRWLRDQNVLVVATGEGGNVDFFDGTTLARLKSVPGYDDADNVRYDAQGKQVIVGWGRGSLTWFTPAGSAQASVRLPAHPESFQMHPTNRQMFVNVPSADSIFIVDQSAHKIAGQWRLHKASANYPLCLDPTGAHAFVACRKPALIITYDTAKGSEVSRIETSGDADDLFYDPASKRLYESCGEGFIDVFQDDGQGHLQRIDHSATASGARTSLYVSELKQLFLAVPLRGNQKCEIRVFKVL